MKDKNKNLWKRSELRELVKNILIYGDKWDLISSETGERVQEKYKKHARRFFIRNSFIIHRIYENQASINFDDFFEFKNKMLVLNFSNMKLKYRDFKPENLRTIKINFYKNLKSLGIENSYFDDIYIQNNFQNIEEKNQELLEKIKIKSIQFKTRNVKAQNQESIPIEENFAPQNSNSDNDNQNKILSEFSHNNSTKKSEKFFTYNINYQNQTNNVFFNIDTNGNIPTNSLENKGNYNFLNSNAFSNLSSNYENKNFKFFNNFNFSNKEKINFTNNLDKVKNYNISPKNLYDCINKYNCSNEVLNNIRIIGDKEKDPGLEKSENNCFFSNNYEEIKNGLQSPSNKKSERDYNSISNRILKKFNDPFYLNLEKLEENANIKKHFLIEKDHVEKKCKHGINLEKLVKKKQKIKKNPQIEKGNMKHKKIIEKKLENLKENQEEQKDLNINEDENIENFLKNKCSLINIDLGSEIYNENQIDLKKTNFENYISEKIEDDTNEFYFKNFNKLNKNEMKKSKKNSDILKLNKNYTMKKLSMDSQLTQISQNNINNNIDLNENINKDISEKYKNNLIKVVLSEEKDKLEKDSEFQAEKNLIELNQNFEKLKNQEEFFITATANCPIYQKDLIESLSKNLNNSQKLNFKAKIPNEIQGKIINNSNSSEIEKTNKCELLTKKKRLRNPKKLSNINSLDRNSIKKDPNSQRKNSHKNNINIPNTKLFLEDNDLNKISKKSCNLEDNISCYSNNFLSSIAFNDNKKFKDKRLFRNFFNSKNNFEKELNSEVPGEYGNEAKIEVDETLSSNHSEVETSKRNFSSRINENYDLSKNNSYFKNNFNRIFNNCNSNHENNSLNQILTKDSKTDLLDLEKNYQFFKENEKSISKANGIPNNYINLSLSSQPHNSFLDKISVLSDKNKNLGNVNISSATVANFFSNSTNCNNNLLQTDSFANNTATNFNCALINNSNLNPNKFNFNNLNVSHNNFINNNNKFLQNTNLNDIYFSFNNKASANPNNENIHYKKNTSRKNSALNKNEFQNQRSNININKNNNIFNNDLNNNNNCKNEKDLKKFTKNGNINNCQNQNYLKKASKKINNFTIIRKVNNLNLVKDNIVNNLTEEFISKENNSNCLTPNINGSQEDMHKIDEQTKTKVVFMIEKISKEEKERQKELALREPEKEPENFEDKYHINNELEENLTEEVSCCSYNLDYLEKNNFNDATVKALISLKKMNSKKNSIDLPVNTVNNNANKTNQMALDKISNENSLIENLKDEKINSNGNNEILINQLENRKVRKLSSKNFKGRNSFTKIESDIMSNNNNDLNKTKHFQVELSKSRNPPIKFGTQVLNESNKFSNNLEYKISDFNNLRKESSQKIEIARKDSFLITKDTRRKETNNTITEDNINKKMSIEEFTKKYDLKKKQDDKDYIRSKPLKINKEKQILNNNYSDNFDDTEYVNLKPNLSYNTELLNNYSSAADKNTFTQQNMKTIKDTVIINKENYGLIARELDIDTIKSLKQNITKSPIKNIKQTKPHIIDSMNNSFKDSQIFTNFNSYIFNIDSAIKNNTNNIYNSNYFNCNNLNIPPNMIDLNVLNDMPQSFPKEKNSHFSYDNNITKECFIFSECNDDLDYYLNSSDSEESIKKQKMLNDKVEKLISSVLKKNNLLINKNGNINTKLDPNNNSGSNNIINNAPNLSLTSNKNNNNNNNSIRNNNKINNNFAKKDIKFKVDNLSSMHSNKIHKEKPNLTTPLNLISNTNNINFENFNRLGNNLNANNTNNLNSFYNGPASITTNNINNFHFINSNGPCIFPITQNITNFGKIMNHTITQSPLVKNDYKIQNQNFNIITDENFINENNMKINKIEKSCESRKKSFKKYSDAELIETTVAQAKMNHNNNNNNKKNYLYSSIKNERNKANKNEKKLKSVKNEKLIFSSISAKNEEDNLGVKNTNNKLNIEGYKILNNNVNKNDNGNKKSILAINNGNKGIENCLSSIENFSDFNLGNFNDCPNNNKQLNNNNYNTNYNSNNVNTYENFRVFDDKNNFFQDKGNGNNLAKPSYLYSNTDNPIINSCVILQNPMQIGRLDIINENQSITICNQNQCKDDFNNINDNPFVLNFVIDEVGKENVKIENNDIFDMIGFN